MRICIYGAGAIGGYLGGQLAIAREDVTLTPAVGPHLMVFTALDPAVGQHPIVLRVHRIHEHNHVIRAFGFL